MSNILENRVRATFTKDEVELLAARADDLMAILQPKTIALTEEELNSLGSIAVDNFVFVKETQIATKKAGGSLLPAILNDQLPEFNKDVTFFEQLKEQEAAIKDLLKRVQHTMRLVAHESMKVANSVYKQYQSLAEMGAPGAATRYEMLKERYERDGAGRKTEEKL